MPRTKPHTIDSAGQDSFLDVVTNIVGILIILVMVVGSRVQQVILTAGSQTSEALEQEIKSLDETVANIENEINDLATATRSVVLATTHAGEARLQVATLLAAAKIDSEQQRQTKDAAHVAMVEAATKKQELKKEIEKCTLEAEGLSHAAATTQEVLSYPTPISRTVTGDELHFRLETGRIAYIPLTELFELAKTQTQRHSGSLAQMSSRVENVGPVQGFMLDYVIETKIDQSRGQVLIRSREWVVRPTGLGGGETAAEALHKSSRFHRVLANITPQTTVTLWCYPDSFEQYRTIREELHRLGVATAGRPLPEGAPIGGSTEGSKSVMQ